MWNLIRIFLKAGTFLPNPFNRPFENILNVADTLAGTSGEPSDGEVEHNKEKYDEIKPLLEQKNTQDKKERDANLNIIEEKRELQLKANDDYENLKRLNQIKEDRRRKRHEAEVEGVNKWLSENFPHTKGMKDRVVEYWNKGKRAKNVIESWKDRLLDREEQAKKRYKATKLSIKHIKDKARMELVFDKIKNQTLSDVNKSRGWYFEDLDPNLSEEEKMQKVMEIIHKDILGNTSELKETAVNSSEEFSKEVAKETTEAIDESNIAVMDSLLNLTELSSQSFNKILTLLGDDNSSTADVIDAIATSAETSIEADNQESQMIANVSTDIGQVNESVQSESDMLQKMAQMMLAKDEERAEIANALQAKIDSKITEVENEPYEPKSVFENIMQAVAGFTGMVYLAKELLAGKGIFTRLNEFVMKNKFKLLAANPVLGGMLMGVTSLLKGSKLDFGNDKEYTKGMYTQKAREYDAEQRQSSAAKGVPM